MVALLIRELITSTATSQKWVCKTMMFDSMSEDLVVIIAM